MIPNYIIVPVIAITLENYRVKPVNYCRRNIFSKKKKKTNEGLGHVQLFHPLV